jgi:hypothetical protein
MSVGVLIGPDRFILVVAMQSRGNAKDNYKHIFLVWPNLSSAKRREHVGAEHLFLDWYSARKNLQMPWAPQFSLYHESSRGVLFVVVNIKILSINEFAFQQASS